MSPALRHLLCNALIQPQFDYACSAWHPNLTKKLKHRTQTAHNNCMRFCLQLDKLKQMSYENTAKNTIISTNFLVWKFCGKAQFRHSFGLIAGNYAKTVPFHKIWTPGN